MSTSRLLNLLGSSTFRITHPTPRFISSIPHFQSLKPLSYPSLRFRWYCSSAAVLEDNATTHGPESPSNPNYHPWPEWVTFVDKLKVKGYISEGATATEKEKSETANGGGGGEGDGVLYTNLKLLKNACLDFARDRYDIIKLLSQQEIQTLVGKGCPNLLRKAVNSAKKLRAYVGLDEGQVCSACVLQRSCDRANVTLNESDGARTVDVVRLLLVYALEPLVADGGTKYEDRDLVEISARNLLHELMELSETIPAPDVPEPAVRVVPKKKNINFLRDDNDVAPKKKNINYVRDDNASDVEMKPGDWVCSKCNFLNFSRNVKCRECGEDGPSPSTNRTSNIEMKKGDWNCPLCNFMNFGRNIRCLKCKTEGPTRIPTHEIQMKKGDWNCSSCGFMNFASNIRCLRCHDERPKRLLMKPGDWECPSCRFLNFRANVSCKKCDHDRPIESDTEYDDMTWKKPF